MNRMIIGLAVVAATLSSGMSIQADDQQTRDARRDSTAGPGDAERQKTDPRAQSGAEAADEASIYTAQLRRCEGFQGVQRGACVDAAKRRLRQL